MITLYFFNNKIMSEYQHNTEESKKLRDRMQRGNGVGTLLASHDSSTHYADALQRFQKDYASYDRAKRNQEKLKRQEQLQKKRLEYLERENQRWEIVQQKFTKQKQRQRLKMEEQIKGIRRTANSNGLAYNPINLSYDGNAEGQKLKLKDQEAKIRRFVRAHNMDHRGNSAFNPLNGGSRVGIQKIIPGDLNQRYQQKLGNYYEQMSVRVPNTSNTDRSPRNHY